MSRIPFLAALAAAALATSACGNNPTDRALTGGAIGAGSGAVVGGLGGAAIGAATTPRQSYYYD